MTDYRKYFKKINNRAEFDSNRNKRSNTLKIKIKHQSKFNKY